MKNKITIIGSGALGTALAKVLFDSGHTNIVIYGIDQNELKELQEGKNIKYFPETVQLPNFQTCPNIKEALANATYVIIATPSFTIESIVELIKTNINSELLLINGSKGFYPGSSNSLHEGIKKAIKNHKKIRGVVSLIGPSHAEEIVKSAPTTICAVDEDKELAKEVQKIFKNNYFRVYVQTDVKGAEAGAAYKNILAIAAGIAVESGLKINTLAGLLTRGLNEMLIFANAIGGKEKTIMGLTGVGDLIVTAMSDLSRNRQFGREFFKKGKKALETKTTVEGLMALKHVYQIGKSKGLELPIVYALYDVIFGNTKLKNLKLFLWKRNLTEE